MDEEHFDWAPEAHRHRPLTALAQAPAQPLRDSLRPDLSLAGSVASTWPVSRAIYSTAHIAATCSYTSATILGLMATSTFSMALIIFETVTMHFPLFVAHSARLALARLGLAVVSAASRADGRVGTQPRLRHCFNWQ